MHSRKDYNAIACQLRSFWEWFRLKVKKKKRVIHLFNSAIIYQVKGFWCHGICSLVVQEANDEKYTQ